MATPEIFYRIGDALGLGLEARDLGIGHMALRALVVYVVVVAIARLGHQRLLDRTSAFDIILGILLGSVASRAITGNAPFYPSLGACAVLVALHALFAAVSFRWHFFSYLVKGKAKPIIRDGVPDETQLRRSHITEHDVDEALRLHGLTTMNEVAAAHLERNGKVSLVKKPGKPKVVEVAVAPGVQTVRIELTSD